MITHQLIGGVKSIKWSRCGQTEETDPDAKFSAWANEVTCVNCSGTTTSWPEFNSALKESMKKPKS